MRVVTAPLAVEVRAGVAATATRLIPVIPGAKALHGCPRLDQGAVDREVLAAQELPDPRMAENRRQALGRDVALKQPVALVVKAVGCHTGSSIPSPTNHRSKRL